MSWYNWLIVLIPFSFVVGMAFYAKRYIRDVVDFLAAGRVCGRYAICVASMESGLCVMTLIAAAEVNFKSGFVYGFWGWILMKFTLFLSLTGFFVYRFRETKAMTIGEFLEKRYSQPVIPYCGDISAHIFRDAEQCDHSCSDSPFLYLSPGLAEQDQYLGNGSGNLYADDPVFPDLCTGCNLGRRSDFFSHHRYLAGDHVLSDFHSSGIVYSDPVSMVPRNGPGTAEPCTE